MSINKVEDDVEIEDNKILNGEYKNPETENIFKFTIGYKFDKILGNYMKINIIIIKVNESEKKYYGIVTKFNGHCEKPHIIFHNLKNGKFKITLRPYDDNDIIFKDIKLKIRLHEDN